MPSWSGEQAAHREQHKRHGERPEVAFAPVTELVLGGGLAVRTLRAEEQQRLIGGVGKRVDRFCEHSGRAREQEPDELGDGDRRGWR